MATVINNKATSFAYNNGRKFDFELSWPQSPGEPTNLEQIDDDASQLPFIYCGDLNLGTSNYGSITYFQIGSNGCTSLSISLPVGSSSASIFYRRDSLGDCCRYRERVKFSPGKILQPIRHV